MRRCGTSTRPRVSDIVAEAGLSNEAFYRHFPSKDALVSAILEDGAERLASYVAHQMEKAPTPEDQVRRWVEGVLSQAIDDEIAGTTLAVLWNGGNLRQGLTSGTASMNAPLASLLHGPFSELGSDRPGLDASLATHAVIGMLADYLQQGTHPGGPRSTTSWDSVWPRCRVGAEPPRTPRVEGRSAPANRRDNGNTVALAVWVEDQRDGVLAPSSEATEARCSRSAHSSSEVRVTGTSRDP